MFNFDEANKKGKEAMDALLKNYAEIGKGFQAIATEASEYSKKSFQDASTFVETLAGAKSVESAFELQTTFLKSSYESFVAEATKMGEMYADLAKTVYKPYEATIAKATSSSPFSAAA
ncbi:phasin family protein [Rhizobium sp. S95]|uniref:Phasin family protein n=1 Tax=Ciceribacter sichuanensis TaxID=2949647 RepID=A0AAJ1BU81_9HYPH|nr:MULTISPECIES: phasin family protein [unclassified Ciceribacter]MCM2397600.1 phasin family protein [Ciceribacter sp. S95]MCM2399706.1 phasin family protein [Ciceribacter sp. S153]MCO5956249.1 phasin family protein [Ciceribacter sp. S101]